MVSQLQVRDVELGKDAFLVQGPLAASGKARKQSQGGATPGPEIFAT